MQQATYQNLDGYVNGETHDFPGELQLPGNIKLRLPDSKNRDRTSLELRIHFTDENRRAELMAKLWLGMTAILCCGGIAAGCVFYRF